MTGVTAAVIGIISITAIKLFIRVIDTWISLLLFLVSLFILLKFRSKLVAVIALLVSGMLMVLFN